MLNRNIILNRSNFEEIRFPITLKHRRSFFLLVLWCSAVCCSVVLVLFCFNPQKIINLLLL